MLQCTAVTVVPFVEALLALATMEGGPEHPPDVLAQDDFLLCELGEHDEAAEHAAHIWTADVPDVERDLWLLWAGTGAHRVYRFATLPLCPALLRDLVTRAVTSCAYLDHHPGPHSWTVTDPLGDLITQHIHGEVQRLAGDEDNSGGNEGP
ncbi:hypothetical protein N7925_24585 [Streptomyces sp. CA-278952]|uniref:hypothetical protein n=1 Tax=Streptomyces sp. CA-278952 TaxID=2980556 RepID=UPI00236764DA|nr:hypothetical protein [Streptomyces sp. CA-278952]WDG31276.1 hypothetical protein N7925_24585 [Streptomyces sp. CA-278952]